MLDKITDFYCFLGEYVDYLVDIVVAATPIERFLLIVGAILLARYGIIKIPFIPYGNKKSHNGCSLQPEMLKNIEKQSQIIRIKYIDTLYEQMTKLEVIHDDITLKMRSIHNSINPDEKDRGHYTLLVFKMEKDVKNLIRKWFKENHYASRSDLEFKAYTDEKITQVLQRVSFYLDENYKNFNITREQLRKEHEKEFIMYAKEKFKDAFDYARQVSIEKEETVKNILNE